MKKLFFVTAVCVSILAFCDQQDQNCVVKVVHNKPVLQQIIEKAQRDWPYDYDMQSYEIQKQTKAYIEVEKIKSMIKNDNNK